MVAGGGKDLARVSSTLIVPTFQAAMRTHGDTVRGPETSSRAAATVGIWGKIVRSPREQDPRAAHATDWGKKACMTVRRAFQRASARLPRHAAQNGRTSRVQNTTCTNWRPFPCSWSFCIPTTSLICLPFSLVHSDRRVWIWQHVLQLCGHADALQPCPGAADRPHLPGAVPASCAENLIPSSNPFVTHTPLSLSAKF
jgi:hypothetical protein